VLAVFGAPSRYLQGRDATAALGREKERLGLADGETARNEPFDLTPAMVRDAIRPADALGR
jgi:hypothetical protein